MKLEAIDPEHPALICVVTVAEIQGEIYTFDDVTQVSYYLWKWFDVVIAEDRIPEIRVSKSLTNHYAKDILFTC